MNKYDIIIIGSGPGGYVSALYAAGFGKRVLVIEKEQLGGVCLNWGCIPTKTLITSAKAFGFIKRSNDFGINIPSCNADYEKIRQRKDVVVTLLKKGIESLFKAKKIEFKKGRGKLVDKGVVEIGNERFESKDIIIATGSRPAELPSFKFDSKRILSNRDILKLETLPKKLLIVGGGVNGCEYAYIYSSFGVEVTIVEMMDHLLPTMDRELGKNMEMLLKKLKVKVSTKTKLSQIPPEYDKALICAGRRCNTEDIGLEKLNIKTEKGGIAVNKNMKTNIPGIYAIGDATGEYLLAHVASHEGIVACNNIAGDASRMDYESVPLCVYTAPQISSVGLTEMDSKEKGYDVKVSKFPFRAIGKSHALGETEGFIKIVGDKKNGDVLGIHMVGSEAALLVAEATMIIRKRLKVKDICETIHAHPTLSEALMETAYLFEGRPIHTI